MLILIIIIALLFKGSISEAWTAWASMFLPHQHAHVPNLHGYTNTCLTKRPYGFPSHAPVYRYWRDRPKSWGVEYSEKRVRGNIDNVRSSDATTVLSSAPVKVSGLHPHYYHNPSKYCKKHASKYPCNPDVSPSSEVGAVPVPGLVSYYEPTPYDEVIHDNTHIRVVEPGREDHGLCGT